jgi:diketogulonate reductase-like aldo/keto reductase
MNDAIKGISMNIPCKSLKDGRSLPALGIGTWLMGGDFQRLVSTQDVKDISAIRCAMDLGFTHIDTAEIYGDGHAEELVGEAIRMLPRDEIFLASKARQGNHTREKLANALDETLKRLRTDYLDLYYLHRATPETPMEETAEALNKAVEQGKIKNIGVCNFSMDRFDKLQSYLNSKIFANQVHYNLAFREPQKAGMLEHAKIRDYFIVAWRPIRLVKSNTDNPQVNIISGIKAHSRSLIRWRRNIARRMYRLRLHGL